jgi:hypothetical protein
MVNAELILNVGDEISVSLLSADRAAKQPEIRVADSTCDATRRAIRFYVLKR